MDFELTAHTEPGARLVSLAETLAEEIGPRAADHDRDASFPFASLAAVKRSGYLAAPVPERLGGLGVDSVHDLLVASSRLARGDAALTLGVNMHLVFVLNVARRWQIAASAGDERRVQAFGGDARGDRARRSRLRLRGQRAGAGPRHGPPRLPREPGRAGRSPGTRCSARWRPQPTCSTRP